MTSQELIKKLKKEFNGSKIVSLESITSKITIASRVRVGKARKFTNYNEISLNNINDYGEVYIPDDAKQEGPASLGLVQAQALRYGDLVLNQRASKLKVGFIGRDYKRNLVANNSMIRIQFNYNCIDLARFVQLYLQLPYVLEYLDEESNASIANRAVSKLQKYKFSNKEINLLFVNSQYLFIDFFNKYKRKILSSAQLMELPIPEFKSQEQFILLSEVLYFRMGLIAKAKKIRDDAQKLIDQYESYKLDTLKVDFSKENVIDDLNINNEQIKKFEEISETCEYLIQENKTRN